MNGEPERYCLTCNYPLHGLTENVCPECGRRFDVTDWETFSSRPLSRLDRLLLSSPGWPMHVLAILCLASGLDYAGLAREHPFVPRAAVAWFFFGILWVARLLARHEVLARRFATTPRDFRLRTWCWLVGPLLFLAMWPVNSTGVPLRIGFLISRAAIERLIPQIPRGGELGFAVPRRAGAFSIVKAWSRGDGVCFIVDTDVGEYDACSGFAYLPGCDHPETLEPGAYGLGWVSYLRLGGDWYAWTENDTRWWAYRRAGWTPDRGAAWRDREDTKGMKGI